MAASKTGLRAETQSQPPADTETLPSLVGRLGDDVMQLLDTKLNLLKLEIKEEAKAYARGGTLLAVGVIIAVVGFALLNMAVAFAVSTLFVNSNLTEPARYALGFVITGFFYVLLGGIVVVLMKNRLAKQELVPNRTVQEFRKDKQWLKNEL